MKQETVDNSGDNVHKGQRHKSQKMTDKPANSPNNKAKIGKTGENLAVLFLMKHGFTVISRNYWKKWGEIDIVAQKVANNKVDLRFVEVKTVSRERFSTSDYEPEDNMHPWKRQRLRRVIETYILEKEEKGELDEEKTDWQVDALSVYVDGAGNELKIEWLEDIVL